MDGSLVWKNQHHQSGTLMPLGAVHPIIASASEAIHGSASQDRRWIASSLRVAMTESNRTLQRRHHRACPGDPRPGFVTARKTWMAGTSPRLSGSIFVDKAHGVDSSVLQAFGDVLGHGEGSSHAASQ